MPVQADPKTLMGPLINERRRDKVDGIKQSGIGREMGVARLEEFLERKTFAEPAPAGSA